MDRPPLLPTSPTLPLLQRIQARALQLMQPCCYLALSAFICPVDRRMPTAPAYLIHAQYFGLALLQRVRIWMTSRLKGRRLLTAFHCTFGRPRQNKGNHRHSSLQILSILCAVASWRFRCQYIPQRALQEVRILVLGYPLYRSTQIQRRSYCV